MLLRDGSACSEPVVLFDSLFPWASAGRRAGRPEDACSRSQARLATTALAPPSNRVCDVHPCLRHTGEPMAAGPPKGPLGGQPTVTVPSDVRVVQLMAAMARLQQLLVGGVNWGLCGCGVARPAPASCARCPARVVSGHVIGPVLATAPA
jgi:hypothetical protein